MLDVLDRWLYRYPFEGRSARRYARSERPAFGDLDDRLLDGLALATGTSLLDLGCGPAVFSRRAAARGLRVIAVDPSRELARRIDGLDVIRAAGEALPLADRSVDVAVCLSSIRHVRDRAATFRELRRVVRSRVVVVELDPAADATRIANHAERIDSVLLRHAFGPLVCRTAPTAATIARLAEAAGFATVARRDDPIQPVYILELA